jgi:hypothetical protein
MSVVILDDSFDIQRYREVSRAFSLIIPGNISDELFFELVQAEIVISQAKHQLLVGKISFMDYCDIVSKFDIVDVDDHAYEVEKNLEYLEII